MQVKKNIKIAPSILSADFSCLGEQIAEINKAGADYIHVDIMDGHFVPNITIGPMVVNALRGITKIPLDVHLMIENPIKYVVEFAHAGADIITVHVEADPHLHRLIETIKAYGKKAGVALNPATNMNELEEILPIVDLVLVMTVDPGFGGQKFIENSYDKIERLSKMIQAKNYQLELEVDGGINLENAGNVIKAGADVLVAGNSIFSTGNISKAIVEFRKIINLRS